MLILTSKVNFPMFFLISIILLEDQISKLDMKKNSFKMSHPKTNVWEIFCAFNSKMRILGFFKKLSSIEVEIIFSDPTIIYVFLIPKSRPNSWALIFGFLCVQFSSCGFCRRIWRSVWDFWVASFLGSGYGWKCWIQPIWSRYHCPNHRPPKVLFQSLLCWGFSSDQGW